VSRALAFVATPLVAAPVSAVAAPFSAQSVSWFVRDLGAADPLSGEHGWSSLDLLYRARSGDSSATTALYARFQQLLRRLARSSGLSADFQNELTTSFLSDMILYLFQVKVLPIHLDSYVARAFRNKLVDYHRECHSRERRSAEALTILPGSGQRVVASCCSEHALRAASGPDAEQLDPSPKALSDLLTAILSPLSTADRTLLDWVAFRAPTREIGDALSISTSAVKVRLHRLRTRLRRASVKYVATLEPGDRMDLLKRIPSLAAETPG
jgi:RNA polymerase sigma factor (sigma-70 family)